MSTEDEKSLSRRIFERARRATTRQDILLFLVAFRIVNALSITTFFQPDEFFQSLEPAWEIAFGEKSGAWITWVSGVNAFIKTHALKVKSGMETPASICYTSFHIRYRLLACVGPVPGLATASGLACRSHDCCAKGDSGGLCGAG